jgi:hypothetical protein
LILVFGALLGRRHQPRDYSDPTADEGVAKMPDVEVNGVRLAHDPPRVHGMIVDLLREAGAAPG